MSILPRQNPDATPLDDLHAVFDAMDVGVAVHNRDGQVRFQNQRAAQILARATHTPGGDPWRAAVAVDGSPMLPSHLPVATALASGRAVSQRLIGLCGHDADPVWLLVSAKPRFADHQLIDVVVTLVEIDAERADAHRRAVTNEVELQRTKAALKEQVARREEGERAHARTAQLHQSVVGAMNEGVVLHAADGRILAANASAERVLGLTLDQMQGRAAVDPRWRLVNAQGGPIDPATIPSEITSTTGKPCHKHLLGVHRVDEIFWLEISTVALQQEPGQARWPVAATFTDVTQARNTLIALQASRARIQRVTEAVPGLLFQVFAQGTKLTVRFISSRAEPVLGVTAKMAMQDAATLFAGTHPDDRARVFALLSSSKPGSHTLDFRHRTRSTDGWQWRRLEALPERSEVGTLWSGVITDTTHQQRLAERLTHAQRRDAMGAVAAGIAHNFNNMLAVILPNIEAAANDVGSGSAEGLREASVAARSAADLVRQLVAVTRNEASERPEPVDMAVVAEQVLGLCGRLFDRRIEVHRQGVSSGAWVVGRRSELHQLLLNLAINARDAMQRVERACFTVTIERTEDRVVMRVSDSGTGMDEHTLKRLGEPFFTTKEPGRGTGLGLATAFGTVRHMGGTLRCESTLGEGTTFIVDVPGCSAPITSAPKTPVTSTLHGQTIVLVDDEPLVRRAVQRMLERKGATVRGADSGEHAIELLEKSDGAGVDAVICDLSMPEMPGEVVLGHIKRRWPHLPVFVLSGYIAPAVDLAQADGILSKPVSSRDLVQALAHSPS